MDLKRKYAQLFEGKLRSNDRSLLNEANAPKTNDQKAENLVKKIIKGNSRFKWLNDDLPKNYTLDDVKTALDDAGYGKEYDKYIKEGEEVNEANEIPAPEDIISDGMAEVDRVIDELLDLEQSVMSSIEMYQEETGDLRFEQILNQGARYIQSAQRNLQYLHKMLKRNL